MEIDGTQPNEATPGGHERIPRRGAEAATTPGPESRRTPDAFVLRCGRVVGGVGVLGLDEHGGPIAFRVGADEDDAIARLREDLAGRRAFCEPALSGRGLAPCLVPRAAVMSRAALLALVRVRNVAPPGATVEHMRVMLGAFASVWGAEPWTAGIDLAELEIAGAVRGTWRLAPMWRGGNLLGIAWIQHAGPVERGELERMAVLFTPEGFSAEAIEHAYGARRIPVPMRRDGAATAEEWIAMAAALSAYAGLRSRARATASACVAGVECHATARDLTGLAGRRQA